MSRSRLVGLLLVAAFLAWAASALGGTDLLCLAPAIVLAGTLLARRYPGARMLLALASRRAPKRRRAPAQSTRRPGRPRLVPRGGLLLAFALAVRPPPRLRPSRA